MSWRLKNGLVVPEKLTAFTKSAAIGQILKEQMNHIVELCKNMEMEITGTEKAILLYWYHRSWSPKSYK